MTTLPAANYPSDNSRTQGQMKTVFENICSVIREIEGGGTHGTATLSTDTFTLADNIFAVTVDTEASAASDDLRNVGQTTARAGRTVLLRCASSARNVVVKNAAGGAGQITTQDGADFTLTDTKQWIRLRYNEGLSPTTWEEVDRSERIKINRLPGSLEETSTTLASDAFVASRFVHELDCESGITDNLDFITQTNDIYMVLIHTKDSGDTITVRHNQTGSGKILTTDGTNLSLDDPNKFVLLARKSTTWEEVARFNFTVAGHTREAKSSNFTAGTGDRTYICTTAITATLPARASAASASTRLLFVNEDASAVLTLDGDGSETIDGSATLEVNPGTSITIVPGGSEWKIA